MVRVVTPVIEARRPGARGDEDDNAQPLFIEFVNSLHWYEAQPIEMLGDLGALNTWLVEQHLAPAQLASAPRTFRTLREHMRAVVKALIASEPLDLAQLAAVQRALSRPRGQLVLFDPATDRPHIGVEINADPTAAAAFRIALSFANFLEFGDRKRLKVCANPGCGFVFVDVSTNATRRWCYMRYCGNRLKVRAFRERQRSESAAD